MQRLKELEEEEKAAETQELPEDLPEPYPEQASERPMRAIRAPRLNAIDRLDGNGRGSRDLENGSPQTPVRRAGRGNSLRFLDIISAASQCPQSLDIN